MPLLKRDQSDLPITEWDLKYMLNLARTYGWKPVVQSKIGSSIEQAPKKDALALATALEKALADIPEISTIPEADGLSSLPEDPLDWFSGDGRMIVRDFIAFCRGGGFVVE